MEKLQLDCIPFTLFGPPLQLTLFPRLPFFLKCVHNVRMPQIKFLVSTDLLERPRALNVVYSMHVPSPTQMSVATHRLLW